jgi:hypothetical protein
VSTTTAPFLLDTPTPEAYPCSWMSCDQPSVIVQAVPFNRHGMESSIAFYGWCDEHRFPKKARTS